MMKFLKYLSIAAAICFILVSILTRVPAVQDRVMFGFIQSLGS